MMKKNYIVKYLILVLLIIMISMCLFDNCKKNRENYTFDVTLNDILNSRKLRPSL